MVPAAQISNPKLMPASRYDFSVREGKLFFEGVDLSSLAVRHGSPLFVFSERMITDSVERVRKAFGARFQKFRLFYATKAGSNVTVLRTIRRQGLGAEVSSEGDIFVSLMAGFSPRAIVFNGPAKSDRELTISCRLGLHCVNLDSMDELERLHAICKREGKTARVAFRVRPDVGAGTKLIQTGTAKSKFGLGLTEIVDAYAKAVSFHDYIKVTGIHAHVGSQNTSIESWSAFVKKLASLTVKLKEELNLDIKELNIGGGVPAVHVTDSLNQPTPPFTDRVPSDEEVAGAVADALKEGGVSDIELAIEPGRRIVAGAALLVTKVITEKASGGESWIYVDAGFNTLPSSSMPWYYHMVPATKADVKALSPYRVAGPLCDNKDVFHDVHGEDEGNPTLPEHRMLPEGIRPGDYLALLDVGAYNMDIQDSFNERMMAGGIYIDRHGRANIMRKRQSYEDLLAYEPHSKRSAKRVVRLMVDDQTHDA
jgi:diaminopimelate decarboxylase